MATSLSQCLVEIEVFFVAVGAFVEEEDRDDWPDCGKCLVCGGSTEGSSWCSNDCYQAWNYSPYVDPREEGWS